MKEKFKDFYETMLKLYLKKNLKPLGVLCVTVILLYG